MLCEHQRYLLVSKDDPCLRMVCCFDLSGRSAVYSFLLPRLLIGCPASVVFLSASINKKQSHLTPFRIDRQLDLA